MFTLYSGINDEESKKNLEANKKKKPFASASFYSLLKIHDN